MGVVNTIEVRNVSCAKTLAQWQALTTIPLRGEVCLEYKNNGTDQNPDLEFKMKLGDGVHLYTALNYFPLPSNITAIIASWVENNLDVAEYAQAVFDKTNKKIQIKGIKEEDGKISAGTNSVEFAFVEGTKIDITFNDANNSNTITIAHETQTIADETAVILAFGDSFTVPTEYDSTGHVTKKKQLTLPANPVSANTVTADNTLTSDQIILGDGNKKVKGSGKTITTTAPSSSSDDNTVPTSKAVDKAITDALQNDITEGAKIDITDNNDGTVTIAHESTTRTDTTESSQPSQIITEITSDATGHVTGTKKIAPDNLIVGLAKDLDAPVKVENSNQFTFRETGDPVTIGEDTAKIDTIKGNTMVWNQLFKLENASIAGVPISNTANGLLANGTVTTTGSGGIVTLIAQMSVNHKYYFSLKRSNATAGFRLRLYGSAIGNLALSDTELYYSSIINVSTAGSLGIYYDATSGTVVNNQLLQYRIVDLTLMFGSGKEPTLEQFEAMFSAPYYPYCEGRLISLGGYHVKLNQLFDNNEPQSFTITAGSSYPPVAAPDSEYKIIGNHKYYTLWKITATSGTIPAVTYFTWKRLVLSYNHLFVSK